MRPRPMRVSVSVVDAPRTRRLLLIEDHPDFAEAMQTVLGMSPLVDAVLVARTLAEGKEMAFGIPGFDLIVTDLRLQDRESTGLIREIKERVPEKPVLVLSNAMDLSDALRAGADAALRKDASLEELLGTVERFLVRADRM